MPPKNIDPSAFSPDILEFIGLLQSHNVRYLIVGGEAVIFYGHIRLTGDVDIFFDCEAPNTLALFEALNEFWGGPVPGLVDHTELQKPGVIFQFGSPPNRIDLLNEIDGVGFAQAWPGRTTVHIEIESGPVPVHYLGIQELIQNKQASARPKDLDDVPYLIRAQQLRDSSN